MAQDIYESRGESWWLISFELIKTWCAKIQRRCICGFGKGSDAVFALCAPHCSLGRLARLLVAVKPKWVTRSRLSARIHADEPLLVLLFTPYRVSTCKDTGLDFMEVFSSGRGFPLLEELHIGNNGGRTTRIPPALFGPQLRVLDMRNVRGPLPDNMGCMVNLTELMIEFCEIATLPDSLGELRSLEVLEVNYCGLTALPATLADLSRLRVLRAMGNHLQSCPPLGALRELRYIDLTDNRLTSLPEGIADLPSLKSVDINGNHMYILKWAVLRRLPLGGHPMPDTFDPAREGRQVLRMRPTNTGPDAPFVVPMLLYERLSVRWCIGTNPL